MKTKNEIMIIIEMDTTHLADSECTGRSELNRLRMVISSLERFASSPARAHTRSLPQSMAALLSRISSRSLSTDLLPRVRGWIWGANGRNWAPCSNSRPISSAAASFVSTNQKIYLLNQEIHFLSH